MCVVATVGTRPMPRDRGASRAATSAASRRPRRVVDRVGCSENESSITTRSSVPRWAVSTRCWSRSASKRRWAWEPWVRQAAGWAPASLRSTPRCRGRGEDVGRAMGGPFMSRGRAAAHRGATDGAWGACGASARDGGAVDRGARQRPVRPGDVSATTGAERAGTGAGTAGGQAREAVGIAAGCPSVLIVRPFVPAWRALRRCRARAGARAGPGRHPGHPTRRRVAIQRAGACRWNS